MDASVVVARAHIYKYMSHAIFDEKPNAKNEGDRSERNVCEQCQKRGPPNYIHYSFIHILPKCSFFFVCVSAVRFFGNARMQGNRVQNDTQTAQFLSPSTREKEMNKIKNKNEE